MSLLNVSGISKKQGENYLLKSINFIQEDLQKIAVAGATGSGKTTLLKIIAGLIQPDAGEVWFEGTRVKGPREKLLPGHAQIAYLSQNFELRNNYRVEELLQMANKLSTADATLVYKVCRIDHLLSRWSDELSGGERQRIAFAKALIASPRLLLLDEPFSNLDAIHRSILKAVINDIEERLNTTCILVSHDPVDLLSWANEIIVLHQGKMIQKGGPWEIYYHPVNEYVAALFGKFNLVSAELIQLFPLLKNDRRRFIRPGDFQLNDNKDTGLEGEVFSSGFMGNYFETGVNVFGHKLILAHTSKIEVGEKVFISVKSQEQSHHLE
jgi:ABC-type sugar transport system ATPase subunit